MSEPITRADMAAIIEAVRNTGFPLIGWNGGPIPPNPFATMADAMAAALSTSPPRVPGASAKLEADFREFIKKAEPGNLAELIETVAYERGRSAGIEAGGKVA